MNPKRKQRCPEMFRSVITGCGAYLPEQCVSNDELAARVDTSDEWIVERTGIHSRHVGGTTGRSTTPACRRRTST